MRAAIAQATQCRIMLSILGNGVFVVTTVVRSCGGYSHSLFDLSSYEEFVAVPFGEKSSYLDFTPGTFNNAERYGVTCVFLVQQRQLRF